MTATTATAPSAATIEAIKQKAQRLTLEDRADLVLAAAQVLFVNGQSTDQVLASAERLGRTLGLRAEIMPRWGELQLKAEAPAAPD